MRALQLDFQRRPSRTSRGNLLLLGAGLATTFALGYHTLQVMTELNLWETKYAQTSHAKVRPAAPTLSPQEEQRLQAEFKQANEVLAHLVLPWDRLFRDIESSPRDGVAMLAIEPDAIKHLVRITAEAKNLDAMTNYLRRLQKRRSLSGVYLQSHLVDHKSPEQPVHFVVAAAWVTEK